MRRRTDALIPALARKVVELELIDTISHETVRQTLKKTA